MNRYCVGPAMAVDWGEGELAPADRRRMTVRILGYFRPYWRPGLLVVACIAVQAVLGLAPAVVFRSLIDALAARHPSIAVRCVARAQAGAIPSDTSATLMRAHLSGMLNRYPDAV